MTRDSLAAALKEHFLCPLVVKRTEDGVPNHFLAYIAAYRVEVRQGRADGGWRFRVRVVDVRLGIEPGKGWVVRRVAYESRETCVPIYALGDYRRETGCNAPQVKAAMTEINEVMS